MRVSNFSLVKPQSSFFGLDLASSVPTCGFCFFSRSNNKRDFRDQSPPPVPPSTPIPITPLPQVEECEDAGATLVETTVSSDDTATVH